MIESLQRIASGGGKWVLYAMMGLSVLSIAIMFERWMYFLRRRDDVDGLGDLLIARLRVGDRAGAEALLRKSPSIEAQVIARTLVWTDGGAGAVSEALEAEMTRKRKELERGMTYLGTLGNNAPFIGLLGTVLGVIEAFHQLGNAGQNQGAMGNVMGGIAEALIATGVGLFVALPAVVAYNIAQKKIGDIEANVGIIGKQIIALIKSEQHQSGLTNGHGSGQHEHARERHAAAE